MRESVIKKIEACPAYGAYAPWWCKTERRVYAPDNILILYLLVYLSPAEKKMWRGKTPTSIANLDIIIIFFAPSLVYTDAGQIKRGRIFLAFFECKSALQKMMDLNPALEFLFKLVSWSQEVESHNFLDPVLV